MGLSASTNSDTSEMSASPVTSKSCAITAAPNATPARISSADAPSATLRYTHIDTRSRSPNRHTAMRTFMPDR